MNRTPAQLENTCNLNLYRENMERIKRRKTALAARLHDEWDGQYHPQEIKLAILFGQSRIGSGDDIDQAAAAAQNFIDDSDLSA